MSAGTPRRVYRCEVAGCDGILVASAVQRGVLEGVCCPVCQRRQTVFLGAYGPGAGAAVAPAGRVADPHNPPIETGPVRPLRRGR